MKKIKLNAIVSSVSLSGKRLDQVLSKLFKEYSRSYLKQLILINQVFINDHIVNQPDRKILGGEIITVYIFLNDISFNLPEKINLNIVYEDNEILVINKPAGLVVHPGAGNNTGTIFNALLYHYKNIKYLPRAGIVHRLDKNTSGLMVIAKTIFSYNFLLKLLKKRKISREYQGIVKGKMISGGTINAPIMRHHKKRICMMVHHLGKKSVTHYKIINGFKCHTHILIRLETGRTHQIRVHMLHIGYPLVGDPLYRGLNRCISYQKYQDVYKKKYQFSRQALHASHIAFCHPASRSLMSWTIPLPQDMKNLLLNL
ncbi:23S rRNA pseudouridylate synthase [Buchnera aphidicola (Diuraphis noxia)]|uniref:Pseudouridine synthase n=1 Tax=Buchnera aphidicola subsp. Diuraphis noxia TaxID=118101 RepID=A0A1B2H8R0_BUCDN|nr:23S rRNA pseudouridine(1911/1915/1917) synthase RluD [Buchnera aphidicola]ANZ22604.1 23S rRNA pseudouridylate synthase [Buchnera aphidicola (Diuraphis noxia)]